MSEKEKISKSLSIGVLSLVFILLAIQFVFFAVKVVRIYNGGGDDLSEVSQDSSSLARTDVPSSSKVASVKGGEKSVEKSTEIKKSKHISDSSEGGKKVFSLSKLPPKPVYKPKPKIDLNSADSSSLVTLYGVGPYFARKIIEFRTRLGGSFVSVEQLMDIDGIDSAKFVGFEKRICIDTLLIRKIDFYVYPLDSMSIHPYIGKYAAYGIERFRKMVSREWFSIDALVENNIISEPYAQRLRLYQ